MAGNNGYISMDGSFGTGSYPDLDPKQSLLYADALGEVKSFVLLDNQIPMGVSGSPPQAGTITGTNVGVTLTPGEINISIPQSVATTADVTFNNITATGHFTPVSVDDLIPAVDNADDIGSESKRWRIGRFLSLAVSAVSNFLRVRPGNTGNSIYLNATNPATTDRVITIKDPGGDTNLTYENDFDQLAQLRTTGNPTFNNISTTGTVDGVDLAAFKSDYDSKVDQAVLTTSSPTFADTTIGGVVFSVFKAAYDAFKAAYDTFKADYDAFKADYDAKVNQDVRNSASPTFAGQTINGNITVTGTVDGVNVSNFYTDYTGNVNQNVRNTAAPTFSGLGLYGNLVASAGVLLDGVDLSVFKADYDAKVDQALLTTSSPTFNNITATGTVDGVDVSAFKTAYDAFKADYDSKVDQAVQTTSSPTFANITNTGLTASMLTATNASKQLVSSTITNTNGCNLSVDASGNLTASMTQNLATTSSPAFVGITINGNATVTGTLTADTLVANTAINTGGVISCQGLTVTTNQTAQRQGTNTTTTRLINSLTTDNTSVTSGTFTHLYFSGQMREYLMHNLSTATGWTSDTIVNQQRDSTQLCFGVYNNSGAINGYLNIQVNSIPSGVYLLEYELFYQANLGIITTSVKHSGSGSYVTIRSAIDTYTAGGGVTVPFKDYFTVTSTGSCDIRWQALSKNASATNYNVYLGRYVRLTKLG